MKWLVDPTAESHFPLVTIKAVEPGCATEIQIEIATTGEVRRFSTTEDPDGDMRKFEEAVRAAFVESWKNYVRS